MCQTDRQTDRQTDVLTDGQNYDSQDCASVAASRGKKTLRPSRFVSAVLWKRINWWWKRILVMHKNARQKCMKTHEKKCIKTHEKSPNGTKAILRTLSEFGSRSITIWHTFFKKSVYLDCHAYCNTLFIETYAVCLIFFQYINKHVNVSMLYIKW